MTTSGKGLARTDAIFAEIEETATMLGIKPGKGLTARVQRESERLPGPEAASPDEMKHWFAFLPAAVRMRARCLEQLMWLLTQIDEGIEAFEEFDCSLAKMRRAREGLRRLNVKARER